MGAACGVASKGLLLPVAPLKPPALPATPLGAAA
eukprot:CAMPEP_0185176890 /NCGR_PEP_ID=MMETSP1139-20130426/28958_1 /TAXON_ID=298111 /ORGANISM="Pavlova sp., Strain CCMP459" /LENGTH=33 /DNA_ID= /DNA_START= /DNA_END= /DNA_ORIENTATION=